MSIISIEVILVVRVDR